MSLGSLLWFLFRVWWYWFLVMVPTYDIFSLDLVMVGIFGIARCNSIWPLLWACFIAIWPGPLLWFLFRGWWHVSLVVVWWLRFRPGSCHGGYIWGNPVAVLLAYVLGFVLLLCPLVPCDGFRFVFDGIDPSLWFRCMTFPPWILPWGVNLW